MVRALHGGIHFWRLLQLTCCANTHVLPMVRPGLWAAGLEPAALLLLLLQYSQLLEPLRPTDKASARRLSLLPPHSTHNCNMLLLLSAVMRLGAQSQPKHLSLFVEGCFLLFPSCSILNCWSR
jgi:hypothetical protein